MVIKDDPVTLASYALKHDLLCRPGWKMLMSIATRLQRKQRALGDISNEFLASKQVKGPVFQFGVQVPCNVKQSHNLDRKNCNNNWQDTMQEEIDSLLAYSTLNDEGHITFLPGNENIHVHFVFAVKHDLRHKARQVAGGHLTDSNTNNSKYSSVVSLRSMLIAIAAGEFNNLFIMVGDIASAYLEAFTLEKVRFIAGPEYGPLGGHLLTIVRALYGLCTSGVRCHDRFADVMHLMGFTPCKADPDL
jgi:hypothetical protein